MAQVAVRCAYAYVNVRKRNRNVRVYVNVRNVRTRKRPGLLSGAQVLTST